MNGTICQTASSIPAVALPSRPQTTITTALIYAVESLLLWHERAKSRRMLLGMDDRMLNDIGIDRAAAHIEGERPFWRS
jgi:uncharacterized protein YjiS (DUF1127 family)